MATAPNATARLVVEPGPTLARGVMTHPPVVDTRGREIEVHASKSSTLAAWGKTAAKVIAIVAELALNLGLIGGTLFVGGTSIAIYPLSLLLVLPGAAWVIKNGSSLVTDVFIKAYQAIDSIKT